MPTTLWLVSHAATAAQRAGTFAWDAAADDDNAPPLDARAEAAVSAWRERWAARIGAPARVFASPAAIARETARAAGYAAEPVAALAEMRFGAWQGRRLADVARDAPEALAAWTRDPLAHAPGGESFEAVRERVAACLDALPVAREATTLVAFTHASVIRAAILHALGAPSASFRALEVAPLSVAVLRQSQHGWVWQAATP